MTTEITKKIKRNESSALSKSLDKILNLFENQYEQINKHTDLLASIDKRLKSIEAEQKILRCNQINANEILIVLQKELLDIEKRTPSGELRAVK